MLLDLPVFATSNLFIQSLPWKMLLLPGGYNGSGTWSGAASAGTSGQTNFVDSGVAPPSLVSNYASFNGTTQFMTSTVTANNLISATDGTIISIVRFNTTGGGFSFSNAPWIGNADSGGFADWGPYHTGTSGSGGTNDGVGSYIMNSSSTQNGTAKATISTATWYFHCMRWTGGNIKSRLNTTDATDVTIGGTGMVSGGTSAVGVHIAKPGSASTFMKIDLRLVAITNTALTNAQVTSCYNEASSMGWLV